MTPSVGTWTLGRGTAVNGARSTPGGRGYPQHTTLAQCQACKPVRKQTNHLCAGAEYTQPTDQPFTPLPKRHHLQESRPSLCTDHPAGHTLQRTPHRVLPHDTYHLPNKLLVSLL